MDKENALDIIREARHPESHELQGYGEEHGDAIGNMDNEEKLLDDFDEWKEQNELTKQYIYDKTTYPRIKGLL